MTEDELDRIKKMCIRDSCDIQITITGNQTGEVMYEQLVPQAQTSYIIISIASFPRCV